MKRFVKVLVPLLLVAVIVCAAPGAKADNSGEFDFLHFVEVPGFHTLIVDTVGVEHRYDGVLDLSELETRSEVLRIASYHIYYGENAVMDVVLRELTAAEHEPGITGSVGGVLTNGYYAVEFDIDAEYEAFLTGLTLENLQDVQSELLNALLGGTSFNMEHLEFIDTEKVINDAGEDDDLCWAAACSNILHYTGWAQKADAGFATPDDVFEVFIDAFSPHGGNATYGFPWFFGGINAKQGAANWAQVDNTETYTYGEFNGFLPEYAVDNVMKRCYVENAPQLIEQTFEALRAGAGSTISFGWVDGSWNRTGGHAISLWGYIQKKNASGFDKNDYYALIVSDSDSDKFYEERRSAPNELWMLTLTPVSVPDQNIDSWTMNGYGGSWPALLEMFVVLNPYSDDIPVEETPSANKFDGVATDLFPYIYAMRDAVENTAFTSDETITIRYGAWNRAQSDWTEARTVTISYRLTNDAGETVDERIVNGSLNLSAGAAQYLSKQLTLPAGEYTITVSLSMADSAYEETYYSNNTATYAFTVVDVPELTLNASVSDDARNAAIAVDDISGLAYYDLFELSVSYLQDGVWSEWTTVAVGDAVPATCSLAQQGTEVKFRLEAECNGVLTNSWESAAYALEREAVTHTLEAGGDLRALLAGSDVADGDTIVLLGATHVNDTNSDSAPWVIDKAVTICGGSINLWAGGILLGADVTFDGTELGFANRVRSAILANGHTLTLRNVTRSSGTRVVHLFCGGLTGHAVTAAAGEHGTIIIEGSIALGNIYAGSMSSDGAGNTYAQPASIVLDNAAGSVGVIYACGALEALVDDSQLINPDYEPDAPAADSLMFPVTGKVSISLRQRVAKTVYGTTGADQNADVSFNGTGDACEIFLIGLGKLTVASGHLVLAEGSDVSAGELEVASDAQLDLSGVSDVTLASFVGGGTIVLGEEQTLNISGGVSGTTAVAIGELMNGATTGRIRHSRVYIDAPGSAEDSFVLLPPADDPALVLKRDELGLWSIPRAEYAVVISSISAPETQTEESGCDVVYIPFTVSFASDLDYSYLDRIGMTIKVNGVAAETVYDEETGSYYYSFPYTTGLYEAVFFAQDETTEVLVLAAPEYCVIPEGELIIEVVVPGSSMENEEDVTLTTVLTIGEQGPGLVASGMCGANITWTLTDDGKLALSGTGEMPIYVTPWDPYLLRITSIEIGDGITNINDSAFVGCVNVTSVSIPDSVQRIGVQAFCSCRSLVSIEIPDSVTTIDLAAFQDCSSLESVTLPDGLTSISLCMFAECVNLTYVGIPNSVTSIDDSAFYKCSSLESITIPDSVTDIGSGVFMECTALKSITIPDGVCAIGASTFYYCSALESVVIPDSVQSIGERAFFDCSSLTSVYIPEGVLSVGDLAFSFCVGLESITLPASVTSIGAEAFNQCENLESVILGAGLKSIGSRAFYNCNKLATADLPDGLTSIGEYAFCSASLESIVIPDSVTAVGAWAFAFVSAEEITIGSGLNAIEESVFYGCDNLKNLAIPDGVTRIGSEAFFNCAALKSVDLPASVMSIEYGAFSHCVNLTTVRYGHNAARWNEIVIGDGNDYLTNAKIVFAFRDAGTCGEALTWMLGEDGILSIGGTGRMDSYSDKTAPWYAYREEIIAVEIGKDVSSIDALAFAGCGNIVRYTVDTSNGYYSSADGILFNKLETRLIRYPAGKADETYEVPGTVNVIYEYAFADCAGLTNVVLGDTLSRIWNCAFLRCTGLTDITIPDSVTDIEAGTFEGCVSLASVSLPKTLTNIGDDAFAGCNSLAEVIFRGFSAQWQEIVIGDGNEQLLAIELTCTAELDTPEVTLSWESDVVTLTWDEVAHAEKYEIWRAIGDGRFELLCETEDAVFQDIGSYPGMTRFYIVRAVYGDTVSEFSKITVVMEPLRFFRAVGTPPKNRP